MTHQVEEIMPVFSHVRVLKAGRLLAAGKKSATLTDRTLSRAFNTRIALGKADGRYAMTMSAKQNRMM